MVVFCDQLPHRRTQGDPHGQYAAVHRAPLFSARSRLFDPIGAELSTQLLF